MFGKRITEPHLADRPVYGRPFRIAMGAMGAVVFVEILALAYGVMRHGPAGPATLPAPPAVSAPPVPAEPFPPTAAPPAAAPPLPGPAVAAAAFNPDEVPVFDPGAPTAGGKPGSAAAAGSIAEPESPATAPPGTGADSDPAPLFDSLAAAARAMPLETSILEALLTTGAEHRLKGNTQVALKNFREVDSAAPGHPRVMAEIAATLGMMRLKDKADAYWEQVEALGPALAGPYFPIAVRQLGGEATAAPEAATPEAPAKVMRIGEIKVEEQAPGSEGQNVSLAVTIDADPALNPAGEDLSLRVFFFDRLSGGEVRPSTADTSYLFPTEPYDWQIDGTETILVNYHQPVFTEEQKRELGERSYHGYVIELYYRNELQEKIAMPEEVGALRFPVEEFNTAKPDSGTASPAPAPPLENALFPDSDLP